jgi:hypothetical protein
MAARFERTEPVLGGYKSSGTATKKIVRQDEKLTKIQGVPPKIDRQK